MRDPATRGNRVSILSADEAVRMIKTGANVVISGGGGGVVEPTALIDALGKRFDETREPRNLTLITTVAVGDRRIAGEGEKDRGINCLAKPGLCSRAILGHFQQSPRIGQMADRNEIDAYNLPIGIAEKLMRAAASGQPGVLTEVGLGTFVDPRLQGGRVNSRPSPDIVRLMAIDGKEYLYFPTIAPDVALIRGTTADAHGYITMENEAAYLDVLLLALAAKNSGGIVLVQVERIAKAGTLNPRDIVIPGFLVDAVVVVPGQEQIYGMRPSPFLSGNMVMDESDDFHLPLTERKVVARRCLMESAPGFIGNVGVGISDGVGPVAREEGVDDQFTLTVEQGQIGGVSATGIHFGACYNVKAIIDMPSMFDFYDGGGLDICYLSFAEVDRHGNVNVHRFNDQAGGVGGFVDITAGARKVVFGGTFTTGGFKATAGDGKLKIESEGRIVKFKEELEYISFNGQAAIARGSDVYFVTERAVFQLEPAGMMLTEIAPGMDAEKDIIAHMGFKPLISPGLKTMDTRLFYAGTMGLKKDWDHKAIHNRQGGAEW